MLSFYPELFLFIYILAAIFFKIFGKTLQCYFAMPIAAALCLVSSDISDIPMRISLQKYEILIKMLILLTGFVICKLNSDFTKQILTTISIIGSIIIISAYDFLYLALAIEIASIPIYTFIKNDSSYDNLFFSYGILSSTIFIFAISLLYLSCGSTNFSDVRYALSFQDNELPYLAIILIVISFCIKIGTHYSWISAIIKSDKAVLFWILNSVLFLVFHRLITWVFFHINISYALEVLGILTICAASIMLAFQKDIFNSLICLNMFSAGNLLISSTSKTIQSTYACVFLVSTTLLAFFGIFLFLDKIRKTQKNSIEKISDLNGLANWNFTLASSVTILFLSLLGFPPFMGFWNRFYTCLLIIEKNSITMALYLISVFFTFIYLLRIISSIWFKSKKNNQFHIDTTYVIKFINWTAILIVLLSPIIHKLLEIASEHGVLFC